MAELQHPVAVYYNKETGERHEIRAEELHNTDTRTIARSNTLYDEAEQAILAPRMGETQHFYKVTSGSRKVFTGERNPEHDARVYEIFNSLNSQPNWSLGTFGRFKTDQEPDCSVEFELMDYQWDVEVHRILDENAIVRHDVFGGPKDLAMSVFKPFVAVEVINTHYPSDEAFAALLAASKRIPYIVLFDIIKFREKRFNNNFVRVDFERNTLFYRPWSYLIRDGQLFKGNLPTTITTGVGFRTDAEKTLLRWK